MKRKSKVIVIKPRTKLGREIAKEREQWLSQRKVVPIKTNRAFRHIAREVGRVRVVIAQFELLAHQQWASHRILDGFLWEQRANRLRKEIRPFVPKLPKPQSPRKESSKVSDEDFVLDY